MNIEKTKKQLQMRKFENNKIELEIKVAERMIDIERIQKQIQEQEEIISQLKSEMESMEG